ncbi:hypothetical protein THRCLA_08551, partial [Thraustotheca clavata]
MLPRHKLEIHTQNAEFKDKIIIFIPQSMMMMPINQSSKWTGSARDYERAMNVQPLLQNKVFHEDVGAEWSSDSTRFWYIRDMPPPQREEIHFINCEQGTRYVNSSLLLLAIEEFLGTNDVKVVDGDFVENAPHCVKVAVTSPVSERKIWFICDVNTYVVEPDYSKTEDSEAENGSSSADPMITQTTGIDITLQVYNATNRRIMMFWIDTNGKSCFYHDIFVHSEISQGTYEGHVWQFVDSVTDNVIAWFCGSNQDTRIEIHGIDNIVTIPFQIKTKVNSQSNVVFDGEQLTEDANDLLQYNDVTLCPNEKYVAAFRTHIPEDPRMMTVLEMAPFDGSPYPDEETIEYPNPGDELPFHEPVIIDIETKQIVTGQSPELYSTAYSNTNLIWHTSGQWCMFVHNARGHQCVRVFAMHCQTGEIRVVIEETCNTFIDHTHAYFKYLPSSNAILWSSERSGYRHLYLYSLPSTFDAIDNLEAEALTSGEYVVSKVEDYDSTCVLLSVRGYYADQDPYYIQYMILNTETKVLTRLTDADGTHESIEFSPDRAYSLVGHSRVDLPPVVELRRTCDGQKLLVVEEADVSMLLSTGWHYPIRFSTLGRDNKTRIYGIAILPMSLSFSTANRPFKVIEHIYAGPQGSFVPKSWSLCIGMNGIAEAGFVVVQIDGMGTANRSKAFHDVCYQNLADSGFPDRILWLKAFAQAYPHLVDISGGVGIYGGSAGGQSAVAGLLRHGDMYKVAAADSGSHDNRVDKLWWNELWMGYPVTDCYLENANISFVKNLQPHQKLLLTVGLMDKNVDPACTMQLVQALIDADKDFEVIPFPRLGHGAGECRYGWRKRLDFFVRHLLGKEPRHSDTLKMPMDDEMGTRWTGSAKDYQRAMDTRYLRGVYHDSIGPNWSCDSSRFWYFRDMPPPQNDEIHFVDCEKGTQYVDFILLRTSIEKYLKTNKLEFIDAGFIDDAPHSVKVAVNLPENEDETIWFICDVSNYTVEVDNSKSNDENELDTSNAEPIASENTGVEITLQIYNAYKHPITMLWVDAEGETRFYQDILTKKDITQITYEGHAWKFIDMATENVVAWYSAPNQNTRIEIHGIDNIMTTPFELKTIINGSFNIQCKGEEITDDADPDLLKYKDAILCPNEKY